MGCAAQRAVLAAAVLCGRLFDGIRRSELCETPTAAGPPPHPPRPGCHFPPRAAASSQPSERGRHQREGGASLLSPRSARVTTQIASSPPQEGSGVSSAVTRRRGRHRIKGQRCTGARRLPGVSRPARGLLLAFLPKRRNRLGGCGRVSETGEQKQWVDTVIMR